VIVSGSSVGGLTRGGAAFAELSACTDFHSVADCLLRTALETMQTPLGNVQLIEWKKGYLEIVAQSGFKQEFFPASSG